MRLRSSTTTVILIDANGTKKILSQEEIDKLVKEEEKRVESGISALTKSPEEVKDSGGLGLAGTIMASMAGAMVGSYLMNKLMNNQNYQQNRRMSYSSPAVYSRSQSSFSKARSSAFGSKTSTSSSGLSKTSIQPQQLLKRVDFLAQRVQLQVVEWDLVVNMVKLLPVKSQIINLWSRLVLVGTQTQITLHTLLIEICPKLHLKRADAYYEGCKMKLYGYCCGGLVNLFYNICPLGIWIPH